MKVCPKTKKSTYFYLYPGAFEQLVCPRRGAFAGLFSKKPNAWGFARGGGREWALLEMTNALIFYYLLSTAKWSPPPTTTTTPTLQGKGSIYNQRSKNSQFILLCHPCKRSSLTTPYFCLMLMFLLIKGSL